MEVDGRLVDDDKLDGGALVMVEVEWVVERGGCGYSKLDGMVDS